MGEGTQSAEASRPVAPANTGWTLIGQLAAGIAHEIKTPTQFVSDNVRFLKDSFEDIVKLMAAYRSQLDALPPAIRQQLQAQEKSLDLDYLLTEIPRALDQSADGLGRIAAIVFAIKELSHPDQDCTKEVDLNHLVRSSVTVCTGEWKAAAQVSLQLADGLPAVRCHPGPLSQVVINLIVNAVHAIQARPSETGEPGQIVVTTARADEGTVEIRIRDNGCGMPEAVRARIFERYFTTKPAGKGTGQGLAMARQIIVEKHGGQLSFESELGRGTTFVLRIPTS